MANTQQLVEAICKIIQIGPSPVPITLMDHGIDGAAEVIGGVVELCAKWGIQLSRVAIDPNLAAELGLFHDRALPNGDHPLVYSEPGLLRQVRFEKG